MSNPDVRLPKNVTPLKYNLVYNHIDLENFTFDGTVKIECKVSMKTKEIRVHANELWLQNISVIQNGVKNSCVNLNMMFEKQEAHMTFENMLEIGEAVLEITFKGILNDQLSGFYRSSYTLDGEKRFMAVTQFEATDARRAFPCWDEPAVKAKFQCTLVTPADRLCVSNTPVIESSVRTGKNGKKEKVWKFGETPVMSTYLLAFVVGEFDKVAGENEEGILVTVYTPVGKSEQGKFALDIACKSLTYFRKFMGVDYPLKKCDMLAIPDFAAGAMENWGCITYREAALLIDEENSSNAMKLRVAMVVAHELAHQWYGNLVTMEWWTSLWLNEGFASYMQYAAVDSIKPEWNVWTEFVATMRKKALSLDSLSSSHPIEVEVNHPDEVNEIFDAISYNKGSAVIRMLSDYMSIETFMKGVTAYLKKFSYGNAVTSDLWDSLGEAAGIDATSLMKSWTHQMGYPVLILGNDFSVTQKRFLASGTIDIPIGCGWDVPLSCVTSEGKSKRLDVLKSIHTPCLDELKTLAPGFKLNSGEAGVYRVQYTTEQYANISKCITVYPDTDRIGIIGDAFALSAAGSLPITVALDLLVNAYKDESCYPVWIEICSNLRSLSALYGSQEFHPEFQKLVGSVAGQIAFRLGWDEKSDDDHSTCLFRSDILGLMGVVAGDSDTVAEAIRRFNLFIADPFGANAKTLLPPDVRQLVFKLAIGQSDATAAKDAFSKIMNLYKTTDLSEEKRRCMLAVGAIKDESMLKKVLEWSISDEVRSQDAYLPIASVTSNVRGRELAWIWFTENFELIKTKFATAGISMLGYIVEYVCGGFYTSSKADEIAAFFEKNPLKSAQRKIDQSLEVIKIREARLQRDLECIRVYFA